MVKSNVNLGRESHQPLSRGAWGEDPEDGAEPEERPVISWGTCGPYCQGHPVVPTKGRD